MLRLLLAITPPIEIVQTMLDLLDSIELPPHRRTKPDQTHLTSIFIGERSELELESVLDAVTKICTGIEPFWLRPLLLTALPARGLKRTVVLECDRPAGLVELHDRLVRRFGRDFRPEPRDRFYPHITIARFGGTGANVKLQAPVSIGDFQVQELRLISSVLKPEGAVHHEIARLALTTS